MTPKTAPSMTTGFQTTEFPPQCRETALSLIRLGQEALSPGKIGKCASEEVPCRGDEKAEGIPFLVQRHAGRKREVQQAGGQPMYPDHPLWAKVVKLVGALVKLRSKMTAEELCRGPCLEPRKKPTA